MSEQKKSRYPLGVRIACIVLTVLVASSAVAYLAWAIINMLAK